MSHSFIQTVVADNCKFHIIKVERRASKCKVKLIFPGAYKPLGTAIVDCLEIIDVGCNLKQFDGLT